MDENKINDFIEDVGELVEAADEAIDAAEKVSTKVGGLLARIAEGI